MHDTLYADDPDVSITYPITVHSGSLEFTPTVRVEEGDFDDITAAWDGPTVANTRKLRIPLFGLPPDQNHILRLVVPGDTDIRLGPVVLSRPSA